MKSQQFTATTKGGKVVTFTAENTEKELKTSFPVQRRPISKTETVYCIILDCDQTQSILGVTIQSMETAGISLSDQDGWKDFERECSRERYEIETAKLEEMFPGLQALKDARNAEEIYAENFQLMMEDEQNDGVRPPARPAARFQDLAPLYPKAVAYLKAGAYADSDNSGKYSAGKKAVKRLESGGDYKEVLADMEQEWSAYCEERTWD